MVDWKETYRKILLGLSLDADNGHTRITKGKNFYLFGGTKTTHGQMQEIAIKFNEQLKKRHKTLDEIAEEDFIDIAHKVGLKNIDVVKKNKKRF